MAVLSKLILRRGQAGLWRGLCSISKLQLCSPPILRGRGFRWQGPSRSRLPQRHRVERMAHTSLPPCLLVLPACILAAHTVLR